MESIIENGLDPIITQAIEEMKTEGGNNFSLEKINLAELERCTGISRAKLRRLKANGFQPKPHGLRDRKSAKTLLSGYSGMLDTMLKAGVSNANVFLKRLRDEGYTGSLSTVKRYIEANRDLIPAKRQLISPQGNRGRRYHTDSGEAFQMDWGFTKVLDFSGNEFQAACFAMICHHCGQCYVEFFPNAKQESLFIGMIHAFHYMGIPRYVLTDNMKSVVVKRDLEGHPVWQKDYESFMKAVGFQTKLCKPRHPFTKGNVERLVRFVKENFLVDRVFFNISDLNQAALEWCDDQNSSYHRATDGKPKEVHFTECLQNLTALKDSEAIRMYLCPARRISFDGFINYEGRRFGIPYHYPGTTARVMRKGDTIYIYSVDLKQLLTTHGVTWSRRDRFCKDQCVILDQPEEFPTTTVHSSIKMLEEPKPSLSFEKFNFDREVSPDD